MRHTSKALALLSLFVFTLFAAAEARADPLVVTGGVAFNNATFGGGFTFIGDGFVLNGHTHQGTRSFPTLPGREVNQVSFGSFNGGLDISGGPGVFNGVSYSHLYYSGSLTFGAGTILSAENDPLFTVVVPFTLRGRLEACTDPNGPLTFCPAGAIVFDSEIRGQGFATATIGTVVDPDGRRSYVLKGVRFDFTQPTPEPATLLLLATGLAGVGAAARRRRRKAASLEP